MSLLPPKLSRYGAVAALLLKYGRSLDPHLDINAAIRESAGELMGQRLGAAMIMRIETSFRILGYPGLAMMLFLMAGAGGAWLAFQIITNDRTPKHRP